MSSSQTEADIIRTTLRYHREDTTHLEPELLRNPVTHYADPQRLAREQEVLFRQFPIIVGHVEQVELPGQFFTHDETGTPILVTRTREGQVKAYVNVCRHRGARIVTDTSGTTSTFSCPYHSWTYDLDGQLRGMRQPFGFGDLDKDQHGLVELPAFERFGLIWVRPSATAASISIALEGFQESYHFCSAHKHTACSAYLDNCSVFVDLYPHVRHAVPLAQVPELVDQPEQDWDYRENYMDQNYVFPCNFVQVMTDHVYIHTVIPTGPGTCVFKCMMLVPSVQMDEKAQRYWQANYDVVRTVFSEDFQIGEGIQQGLGTGANEVFTIGKYESGIQLAERAIDDALTGRLACPEVVNVV